MSKLWKTVAGIGCLTLALGFTLSGERLSLSLTNNTERAQKVEITRGKDSTCVQNAAWDSVLIQAGSQIQVPFDDHAFICWRVDGAGPNGESSPWRSISCGLEKPVCSANLFQ